jgi:hypothetical protein
MTGKASDAGIRANMGQSGRHAVMPETLSAGGGTCSSIRCDRHSNNRGSSGARTSTIVSRFAGDKSAQGGPG